MALSLNAYLTFDGNCAEAFAFYAQATGGAVLGVMRFGDSPPEEGYEMPAEHRDLVMHAALRIGDSVLMGSDALPDQPEKRQGFSVSIQTTETAEAERIFAALADGASVTMPLAETFWALRFGMLTDRFGTPWMVNCARPTDCAAAG
ncbi:VOC family protein [Zavarzinia sp. CC-PAN008]|uniref:VOC family protein n=1 Tax=Zavarzinia sp. CC-PAN008 TaxID=3243332 RepID=UPI003F7431E6